MKFYSGSPVVVFTLYSMFTIKIHIIHYLLLIQYNADERSSIFWYNEEIYTSYMEGSVVCLIVS